MVQQELNARGYARQQFVLDDVVVLNSSGWTCPLSDIDEAQLVYIRGVLKLEQNLQPFFSACSRVPPCPPRAARSTGRAPLATVPETPNGPDVSVQLGPMVRWYLDYDYPSFLKAPRIYAVGRFLTVHLRTPAQPYARPFEHLERLGRIAAAVLQLIVQYPHISLLQVQATVWRAIWSPPARAPPLITGWPPQVAIPRAQVPARVRPFHCPSPAPSPARAHPFPCSRPPLPLSQSRSSNPRSALKLKTRARR